MYTNLYYLLLVQDWLEAALHREPVQVGEGALHEEQDADVPAREGKVLSRNVNKHPSIYLEFDSDKSDKANFSTRCTFFGQAIQVSQHEEAGSVLAEIREGEQDHYGAQHPPGFEFGTQVLCSMAQ